VEGKTRRGGLVGPIILITLGVVFLMNNLGVLNWSVWVVIFRLWPVLLIAAGLDILVGRRSFLGSLLALVLTLAVLAGALWLVGTGVVTWQPAAVEEISQPLGEATQADVVIAPAVGPLHVASLVDSTDLVAGTLHLGKWESVKRDFAVEGETAMFTLRGEGAFMAPAGGWGDGRGWDVGLNSGVPLDLEVSLGVGDSEVDLTGLTVSDLKVSMGLGRTTVTLPDEGDFRAKVDGAIGQTIVVIPAGLAARVRVDAALAGSDVPDSYQQQGDVYVSPGYADAENRVDLEVGQAIGSVVIRRAGGE